MELFHRFYMKVMPLIDDFRKKHRAELSISILSEIDSLLGKAILLCCDIYKADILKEKHSLDIDLSDEKQFNSDPSKKYVKKFNPCEVCGETRVSHLAHIIPRNIGGTESADNLLSLCANHHYLFDNHRLLKEEWDNIQWSGKHTAISEYALQVRYKRHQMFWKYDFSSISQCECGCQDFTISYEEKAPIIRNNVESYPGYITKNLTCNICGESYGQVFLKNIEYKWWQAWIIEKIQHGEKT